MITQRYCLSNFKYKYITTYIIQGLFFIKIHSGLVFQDYFERDQKHDHTTMESNL